MIPKQLLVLFALTTLCLSAEAQPPVEGPDLVCSTATFSISGGCSVTWSISNPSIATINSSGELTKVGNGPVTVIATCAGWGTSQKPIWVGIPTFNSISYLIGSADGTTVCANQNVTFLVSTNYPSSLSNWDWNISAGSLVSNGGSSAIIHTPGPGVGINIQVTADNSCGTGQINQSFATASVVDGQFCFEDLGMFSVYPNPSERSFTIEAREDTKIEKNGFEMVVEDLAGANVFRKKITSGQTIIDNNDLKPGVYIITIYDKKGNKVEQKRIFIKN